MCRGCHRQLSFSMRIVDRHGHSINSAEDRTPHEPRSVICMRLAARSTYSGCGLCHSGCLLRDGLNQFLQVATVDRDGQRINSAGARTPHEPLSVLLIRSACSGCAVAITLMSAHWQRVGRRPGRPLNAVRSAAKAGACAESCKTRTLDFATWGVTR